MAAIATLSNNFQITIPKDVGVLIVPVPAIDTLQGIARGADTDNYRDRQDRY